MESIDDPGGRVDILFVLAASVSWYVSIVGTLLVPRCKRAKLYVFGFLSHMHGCS